VRVFCGVEVVQVAVVIYKMPLFGKKDSAKKKKDGKDTEKVPQLEDNYEMKDVLGT
jgi:hypothetical protein